MTMLVESHLEVATKHGSVVGDRSKPDSQATPPPGCLLLLLGHQQASRLSRLSFLVLSGLVLIYGVARQSLAGQYMRVLMAAV